MSAPSKYYLSPVDYEAWGKGYMPPSAHVLIDKLSYRGARVVMSVQAGTDDGPSWWLVVQGKTTPKMGLQIARLLNEWEVEEEAARVSPNPAESRPDGWAPACDEGKETRDELPPITPVETKR